MSCRRTPRLGDLIEIDRTIYAHWAIYVGDDYVIHLAPPNEFAGAGLSSLMSALTDRAIVKKELLSQVAGTADYQINNKYDDRYPPLPVHKIVKRALEMEGKEVRYSLTRNNCEHFVTKLRYGVPLSGQVEEAVTYTYWGVGIVASLAFGILMSRARRERH